MTRLRTESENGRQLRRYRFVSFLSKMRAAWNTRPLEYASNDGSHLNREIRSIVQSGKVTREACQRFCCLDFSFTLRCKLHPFLIGINSVVVPDVEVVADHPRFLSAAADAMRISFLVTSTVRRLLPRDAFSMDPARWLGSWTLRSY